MNEILGKAKTVRDLLQGAKYSIDYYQREYKWGEKQIGELLEDLTNRFLRDFDPKHPREAVADYGQYFLGSVILSRRENKAFIVDGQQRLTSLSLLLIYLRNAQSSAKEKVNVDELIFSEKYGKKSFNLDVPERTACMEALFAGQDFNVTAQSESVQRLAARYADIEAAFPAEIDDDARPYFMDWLLDKVSLVEITALSDEDAYTIFETMNDRGLSLSPAEMLKGFVLSKISDSRARNDANTLWKARGLELAEWGEETNADCFKAWFRSQYSTKIRERKKNAHPEDFDLIGTEFHRWLRDHHEEIGLDTGDDFVNFIRTDFEFYSRQFLAILNAGWDLTPGLEAVRYVSDMGFTLYPMLLLAPLKPGDSADAVQLKMRLVAKYLDILLARRVWNYRSTSYSTMQYATFLVMRKIRGMKAPALAQALHDALAQEPEVFASNRQLRLHQQNRKAIHRFLARFTDYVETESGGASQYTNYVNDDGNIRYEVEHIWADKPDRHKAEFAHPAEFAEQRNRIGGLLLLPKKFNASYGALTYAQKLPHYLTQNMLARSLHTQCYQHNPGFTKWVKQTSFPFQSHDKFLTAGMEERGDLYLALAEKIWNPDQLLDEVKP